jgi:chromosome segregation ATPase
MSAEGAAVNPEPFPDQAIGRAPSSPDLAWRGAFPTPAEVDVLRNSLSAVMVKHREQSKQLTALAADHARQSREVAALSAQNLELSRNTAALGVERDNLAKACADAAGGRAAAEAERDDLRYKYDDVRLEYDELLGHHGLEREWSQQLEKRLGEIESSNSWRATRRLRAFFARHPLLRRLAASMLSAVTRRAI